MHELVSIIIPVYNSEDTLERALNSCFNQTYHNIEVIAVVNGTTDKSLNILKKVQQSESRLIVLTSLNRGRSLARNIGIKASKGKFIQFLDSDDTLCSDKIMKSINFLSIRPNYYAYSTGVEFYNNKMHKINVVKPMSSDKLLFENIFPICSPVIRKENVKLFQNGLEYNEDWLFWAENLYRKNIYFTNYIGSHVHITGKNTMADWKTMVKYTAYVRSIISGKYKSQNLLRTIRRDFQLLRNYFLVTQGKDYALNNLIKKNMKQFYIIKMLYHIKLFRVIWLSEFKKSYYNNNFYSK